MRFLRHSAVQRFFSVGLLLSLGLWLAAPAAGADAGRVLASQAEWLGTEAPAPVEAAFEEALVVAAEHGVQTPEAFAAAFADALAARPDPALAQFLGTHDGADALLAVLYGQLLRAFSHHTGLEAAPASPVAAPAGGSSPGPLARLATTGASVSLAAAPVRPAHDAPVVSLAERSAAQPLGP